MINKGDIFQEGRFFWKVEAALNATMQDAINAAVQAMVTGSVGCTVSERPYRGEVTKQVTVSRMNKDFWQAA